MIIILMGVSGAGKTTVGRALAAELGWRFVEGDDFHPPANISKMRAGIPLTDADRLPWLQTLKRLIGELSGRGEPAIIACSALKKSYRDLLRQGAADIRLVLLAGDYHLILSRLQAREGHFMPPDLLRSQLDTLEIPKNALVIPIAEKPEAIVDRIKTILAVAKRA